MKRVFLSILMFMGLTVSALAQKEALYYYSLQNQSFAIREWIDRAGQMYYFDGDSEDDCTMEMKNYKKNGNTETFDVYVKAGYDKGKKRGSITLVTDPDFKVGANLEFGKQIVTLNVDGYTQKFGFLTEAQQKAYDKLNGKQGSSDAPEGGNVVEKAKEQAKGLLNKGKNLFKKKK